MIYALYVFLYMLVGLILFIVADFIMRVKFEKSAYDEDTKPGSFAMFIFCWPIIFMLAIPVMIWTMFLEKLIDQLDEKLSDIAMEIREKKGK